MSDLFPGQERTPSSDSYSDRGYRHFLVSGRGSIPHVTTLDTTKTSNPRLNYSTPGDPDRSLPDLFLDDGSVTRSLGYATTGKDPDPGSSTSHLGSESFRVDLSSEDTGSLRREPPRRTRQSSTEVGGRV